MNATELLAMYERVADAPGAVGKLRRLVLDLAVKGKLVEQFADEEIAARSPVSPSGQLISHEHLRADARPFEVPRQWSFTTLGHVLDMVNGRAFKPAEWRQNGLPIIRIQNLNNPLASFNHCDPTTIDARHTVRDGDFLISWSGTPGTSFGAFIWSRGDAALNQHIFRCVLKGLAYSKDFLRLAINSQLDVLIGQAQGGVGLQHVTKGTLQKLPLPQPPLAEQHRIVAKVDELMALCDQLEAARTERESARDRLAAASLARLNAPDPDTFQSDARFALNVLPVLSTRPDQVRQLRQSILNLAVRGKLVQQETSDPSAASLLESLEMNWEESHDDLADTEPGLPNGWASALIEHCCIVSGGIQKTPARTPRNNAYPYLGVSNVQRGRLDLAEVKSFELVEGELARYRLVENDILIVEGNGSPTEIGRCAVWRGEIADCVHQNHIIRCRPLLDQLTSYIALYLNSPDGMREMRRLAITSAGLYSLSVGKIRKIPLQLPPLAEQHRIVAKVGELMTLCDQLEASLAAGENARGRLFDSVLHGALDSENATADFIAEATASSVSRPQRKTTSLRS